MVADLISLYLIFHIICAIKAIVLCWLADFIEYKYKPGRKNPNEQLDRELITLALIAGPLALLATYKSIIKMIWEKYHGSNVLRQKK